ncbi:hypothetical protein J1605_017372 [Eschrichtius robustus]|uniref:Uncharacterized protein n=1 Tax=Eschrichtius robustus TaxID=9764 RepID=A0AB34I0P4_ESCRO|nr:hypothetical protein J1605_017372 [Eschrichtius robustus]
MVAEKETLSLNKCPDKLPKRTKLPLPVHQPHSLVSEGFTVKAMMKNSVSTGSRRAGSVVVAHGPSCSTARGIFPDQGWNPCPLHWQADSQPLRHQGSP